MPNHITLDTRSAGVEEDCVLCEALVSGALSSSPSIIVFESPTLAVLRDVAPIVPGHLLIVSKRHAPSFADAEDEVWTDLPSARRVAIDVGCPTSGAYFFFEHGASAHPNAVGGCIAHAHLHFIPAPVDMVRYLRSVALGPVAVTIVDMRISVPEPGTDYLYYEDKNGLGCVLVDFRRPLPRQFVRMAVAEELGLSDWDWRLVVVKNS